MPHESDYFEEAYALFSHQERVIARTAEVLYGIMRRRYVEMGDKPRSFNIRFFFLSVAEVIAKHEELSKARIAISQESCAPIKVLDLSTESKRLGIGDCYLSQTGIADAYIDWVKSQSRDDGDEFDLDYALRMACEAINSEIYSKIVGEERWPEIPSEMNDSEFFEYWISGFISPKQDPSEE